MRALIQRVHRASVSAEGETTGAISKGLLVFLGIAREDGATDREYITRKILGLRIFEDDAGKMNRSVVEEAGEILLVSQFTLYGDVSRGRRPGFDRAAPPDQAQQLYTALRDALRAELPVKTGVFGAHMDVSLVNNGPATFWVDSHQR